MATFFPPSSPTSLRAHQRSMAPPALPLHAVSSSTSSSPRRAPSSSSFKDRLVFKKKTPLMASNHTKIKSGYATPSTSSPPKTSVHHERKGGRENREGGPRDERVGSKAFTHIHGLLSPSTSSTNFLSSATSSSPPRVSATKATTTKTLLANPRAILASSSAPILTLALPALQPCNPLILGRRLNHPTRLSSSKSFVQTHLQTSTAGSAPTASLKHLPLPRHALHASRLHCIVQPLENVVRVAVLGQNGMKVMGKRVKCGETVIVDAGKGGEVRAEAKDGEEAGIVLRPGRLQGNASGLMLDFWGVKAMMPWGTVGAAAKKAAEEAALARETRSSSPLTEEDDDAHMYAGELTEEEEKEDADEGEGEDDVSFAEGGRRNQAFSSLPPSSPPPPDFLSAHRSSSPDLSLGLFSSSPPPSNATNALIAPSTPTNNHHYDDAPSSPASSHHSYVFDPHPSPAEETISLPSEPLGPIPAGTDLPSLLSSTLVFSHQTSMSLPDLVRAVLEAQPGLRELGKEEEWRGWCAGVLDGVEGGGWAMGMFGRIERKGKDASGHPLLDLFFYDPARDPDQIRAKELGGLMRPLRGTQRQGKTYFFKRPSTPGKKRK